MTTKIKTGLQLPLPILDELPAGKYSLGVPIKNDSVQVGFSGIPDTFDRVLLNVAPGIIEISRKSGSLLQIESGKVDHSPNGDRKVTRHKVLAEPTPSITLRRNDGHWEAEADLADPAMRVGLSRFAAKIGDTAVSKHKKSKLK